MSDSLRNDHTLEAIGRRLADLDRRLRTLETLPIPDATPSGGGFTLDYFLINGRFIATSSSTGHVDMSIDWSNAVVEGGVEIDYPDSPSWASIATTDIDRPWLLSPGTYLVTVVASTYGGLGPVQIEFASDANELDIPSRAAYFCNLQDGPNLAVGNMTVPILLTTSNNPSGADYGITWKTGALSTEDQYVHVEATVWRMGDCTGAPP